jgi:hypothetical protein
VEKEEMEPEEEIKPEVKTEYKKSKNPEINETFMDKIFGKVRDFLDNAE